jgi:hypothetical protein
MNGAWALEPGEMVPVVLEQQLRERGVDEGVGVGLDRESR